jgi:Eukaryotic translation initiation factor eIF2A
VTWSGSSRFVACVLLSSHLCAALLSPVCCSPALTCVLLSCSHLCAALLTGAALTWNATGRAVLILGSSDVDASNKSYYGENQLHFMMADPAEADMAAKVHDHTSQVFAALCLCDSLEYWAWSISWGCAQLCSKAHLVCHQPLGFGPSCAYERDRWFFVLSTG